jgi:3-phenylpropionate/trans-cinnamate dioxygenase ferredoxin component
LTCVPETIDICPLDELPPGSLKRVETDEVDVVVVNCGGELFALEDTCSHGAAWLSEGELDPEACTLECPQHGSLFDLRSGKPLTLPAYVPQETFPVDVVDGVIKLELD